MTDTLFLADFRRAAQSPTCPFCALRDTTTVRYIGSLLTELTLAADIHQRLARSRGFCSAHATTVQALVRQRGGEGGGVATLYSSVLQSVRAELAAGLVEAPLTPTKSRWRRTAPPTLGASLATRLEPQGPCLLCEHAEENDAFALGQLVEDLSEQGGQAPLAQLYQASPGACLPHFQRLLRLSHDEPSVRWLTETQLAKWELLESELEAYRLGRREGSEKKESWERTLAQLSP
ncbi:DUF6062 family protein [Armatimonas rosea]|uniref:Uncharacterized protein n=1 Tax=Armatimonas rosea TaxID=685828 RepID=A0A7W9SW98_ARMRO|nr:DUF6062 family protein [Armatimonas rosea]MBB6053158.1 hypothetical protein [Armatimonas rosea]